jgi:uncharacterized protein YuzE
MEPILREGTQQVRPNLATLPNVRDFVLEYDTKFDTLHLVSRSTRPAVSVDCAGELWVRVDVSNGDIVGVEIEDFEAVFLRKHPEVAPAWDSLRSKLPSRHRSAQASSFPLVIAEFLKRFLANCSRQQTMEMMPA